MPTRLETRSVDISTEGWDYCLRFLSRLALVWPGDLPIPRAPPRLSPTEGTFSECLDCEWQRHADERARHAAYGPELALRNERSFGTPLLQRRLPWRLLNSPFVARVTQLGSSREQPSIGVAMSEPDLRLGSHF
jgi:hypothetical protein